MREFFALLTAVSVVGSAVGVGAQTPAATRVKRARAVAARSAYKPVASVRDIMRNMVAPAAQVILDAVSSEITPTGVVDKAPKDDAAWRALRNSALIVIEGSNLVMMPGRLVGGATQPAAGAAKDSGKEPQIELTPVQIEAKLRRERPLWNRYALGLIAAASVALKAAEAKDVAGISDAGDGLDMACEACHLHFWYPEQTKVLEQADKALRQRKPQ